MNMRLFQGLVATLIALLSVALGAVAFQAQNVIPKPTTSLYQSSTNHDNNGVMMSRSQWIQTAAAGAAAMMFAPMSALAKDVDPSVKGTKQDPEFEACLSTCMYECTKPKGIEQKSRKECLPECKSKCAKTKAQTMLGTPLAK